MGKINQSSVMIFLLLPILFFGQSKQERSSYYNWFDKVIGSEHTGLFNGKQYVNLDVNRIFEGKHAFYKSDDVLLGSLLYQGQHYFNVEMKYNLETDMVLAALKSGSTAYILQLIRDNIAEFTIDGSRFVRIDGFIENNDMTNGFHEVLLETPHFSLLKRHKKIRKKKLGNINGSIVKYEFVNANKYVLLSERNYKRITSKTDIIKIYPGLKKEIKDFYEDNKKLRKSQPDRFMQRLFEKIVEPAMSKNEI
ncbi:hypothetical protein U6A24_11715 [Aquimarina gracilis]|uniref:DKNYY family protein n=1 Tax=Aquimarina gracilis TaxID=874422 RepID=A0ABU5ZW92_9FLAO|nr:hypothetical protein [Aquimarina gracilis]MEB3346133.1 hypothetical protein [Aquimarina gracilis]